MSELKPCPFCGGSVEIEETESTRDRMYGERRWWGVVCRNTINRGGSCAIQQRPSASKEAAIERWNRRAQPADSAALHQALTDPENQPNQHGVAFMMRGPKFAFKVGAQQFTLDYEPTEPGDFEYMRDMLIHAFSIFTPDVNTAQTVPLLSAMEAIHIGAKHSTGLSHTREFTEEGFLACVAEVEQAVRAKLGAVVPQWLPIETAPRGSGEDGPSSTTDPAYIEPPHLLLWTQEGIRVGYYDWYYHPGYGRGADPNEPAWRGSDGERLYGPTHWQPLPPPPGIVGKEGA